MLRRIVVGVGSLIGLVLLLAGMTVSAFPLIANG